jgi:hypothetical protein
VYKNNFSNFCLKLKESWMEEHHLYITQEYCKYGDLLDYLEKIEKFENKNNLKSYSKTNNNVNCLVFNETFYWDLIFEMICVKIN